MTSSKIEQKSEPSVSIVISSYNYGGFLRQAIDSALNQTYRNVEIVAVDDGSTDASRDIIRGYGDRIISHFKPNGGQASALNVGFALSHGEMVLFLDSDDFLMPHAVERVIGHFHLAVAKVQYSLGLVGLDGELLGTIRSQDHQGLRGSDAMNCLLKRGWYMAPPTSGNAYSRAALERVLPIPEADFIACPDAYLHAVVPFEGDVISIPEVLAAYRCHGTNFFHWAADTQATRVHLDYETRPHKYLARAAQAHGFRLPDAFEFRNFVYVRTRLASLCLARELHPFPHDTRLGLARQGVYALWRWWGDLDWRRRILWSLWFLLTAITPVSVAKVLIGWAYNQGERPQTVRFLLSWINGRLAGVRTVFSGSRTN